MIMNDEVIDLLIRLSDYMGDRADMKEYNGETYMEVPNEEAVFQYEIDEMLKKL